MENQPGLSDSEREVLRVLWDRGPGTVREINEVLAGRGRRWAYTTVATLLQRLAAKHYVAGDPSSVPHVYRAAVSRDELLERGSGTPPTSSATAAAPLVLALVQGGRLSHEDLSRLRRILDQAAADPATTTEPQDKPKRRK